jgi:hypothetical protein
MTELRALVSFNDPAVGTIVESSHFFVQTEREALELQRKGLATCHMGRLPWAGLRWPHASVVIIASGISLTADDCALVERWRNGVDRRVIVINTSYQRAPWADVLYACDGRWWEKYHGDVAGHFAGALWTQDELAAHKFGLHYVRSENSMGLNRARGVINVGANSGSQAIGLAYQAGAEEIILLGFDCRDNNEIGRTHWHGDHPGDLQSFPQYAVWLAKYKPLAKDLRDEGVRVVNATRRTDLLCFPFVQLEKALHGASCLPCQATA